MTSQLALTRASLATSQWSPKGSQASDVSNDITTSYITLPKPIECLQTNIEVDIKIITAYLVKERALEAVQATLGRISDIYRRCIERRTIEQAISQLQAIVQKLANKIENKLYRLARLGLYTTIARQGLSIQIYTQQSLNTRHVTLQKLVPLYYKCEIVVV